MNELRVRDLVDRVHSLGGTLVRSGPDGVKVYGIMSAEQPELFAELRENKPELLDYLRGYACVRCSKFSFPLPDTVCYWCRQGRTP
jgi:hypothetical protein